MTTVPSVKLNNGKEIPIVGLGTWLSKPGELHKAVQIAIDAGYRHIDCALVYNNENEIGRGIKAKIADNTVQREELFITSKLWNTYHRRAKVLDGCKRSLSLLELEYLDLYLIHWPVAYQEGRFLAPKNEKGEVVTVDTDYIETWKGMEELCTKGLVKSIGLSNFSIEQTQRILDVCKIKPAVLQVECHPYLNQKKLIEFCRVNDIAVVAHTPLGSPSRPWGDSKEPSLMEDITIRKIADKYKKTPAQILLKFNVQRGVVVIPKSVTEARIRDNLQIFDFELSNEDLTTMENFKETCRYCHMDWLKNHIYYPFKEDFVNEEII